MTFDLTEEQRAFQETARDFAAAEMAPFAAEWDEQGIFPVETLRKAAALGFAGIYVGEQHGGSDLTRHGRGGDLRGAVGGLPVDGGLHLDPQHGELDDRQLRRRRAARALPAEDDDHGPSRELLPDRAGLGVGRGGARHARGARRRPLRAQRIEGLHLRRVGLSDLYVCMVRTGGEGPDGISCIVVEKGTPGLSFGKRRRRWAGTASRRPP